MTATITENMTSRRLASKISAELSYTITGTADETEAITLLEATAPETFQGLPRRQSEIEPEFIDTLTPARCIWRGTASYAANPGSSGTVADHPSQYGFDTSGGSQHITQAKAHVGSYAPSGATVPDHGGAIGVSNGNVEGVDITVPVYTWSETHFIDADDLTNTYRGLLHALTGKVNNATFKGMAAGECLFLGASANWTKDDDGAMVTFKFAGSPNRIGLTVGTITGINKKGWEYLWVEYEQDGEGTVMVAKPKAVHIEQVYDYGNFAALGI